MDTTRLEPHPLNTVDQQAEAWQVSRAHIYALLNRGLPSVKIGRSRRFDPNACDAWLAEQQDAA